MSPSLTGKRPEDPRKGAQGLDLKLPNCFKSHFSKILNIEEGNIIIHEFEIIFDVTSI